MKWMVLTSALAIAMIVGVLLMFGSETGFQEKPEKVRVAVIMAGLCNDHSWNESHCEAIQKAQAQARNGYEPDADVFSSWKFFSWA